MKFHCYYYKMVVRKTGKEFGSNFGWTDETPVEFMNRKSDCDFKCVVITKEEFHKLRKLGK